MTVLIRTAGRFLLGASTVVGMATQAQAGSNVRLSGKVEIAKKSPYVRYEVGDFWAYVHVPSGGNGSTEKFGLLVFIDSKSLWLRLPPGWKEFLDKNRLIYVCPQGAGNKVTTDVRAGRAVVAAYRIMKRHNVDKERIYISGFSGGARVACMAAFYQNDLFLGVIPMAGAMFPRSTQYGSFSLDENANRAARRRVRFALIAHRRDQRYKDIMTVYKTGYVKNNFKATIIEVPEKGHGYASAGSMQKALEFVQSSARVTNSGAGTNHDKLTQSKAAWRKLSEAGGGNYEYDVKFSSWTGSGHTTTIVVKGNKVIQRRFRSISQREGEQSVLRADETEGVKKRKDDNWMETGEQLGTHKEGTPPKTIDELYVEAEDILSSPLEPHHKLYLLFHKNGVMRGCFYVDRRIADDAPQIGPRIDTVRFHQK